MEQYLIMCRSLTHAQRSQRLLERSGIVSTLIKAPVSLTKSGCGYALTLRRHVREAAELLGKAGMLNGKIYVKKDEAWSEYGYDLS